MEWVGLAVWVLILALALPVSAGGVDTMSFALQLLLVLGGIATCILYIVAGDEWLAWASFGLAIAATATIGVGAAGYTSDDHEADGMAQEVAGFAGAEAMLLPTAAFAMLLAATGVTTV